jgi:crotonobetainyl-CoA:carnitine CoA-transferase CaiB-like acyl-CoA transferase
MRDGLPLGGLQVLELGTSIAGPYCTLILSALGADVVKIEPLGRGDDTRGWGPPFWNGESAMFLAINAGKRSVAVDLKDAAGLAVAQRLAERSDVVVQNLRPELADRLGLGFDDVVAVTEDIIYCSIGSFGKAGPLARQPGYDPLMQAAAGIMSITGEPDRAPVRTGPSIVDQGTGMWAAIAILGALRLRDAGAGSQLIDTSLYETALNWLPYQAAGLFASGLSPRPFGSGISVLCPYEAFRVTDGWVMIAAGNDRLFGRLCAALGSPRLAADPRYETNASRVRNRATLVPLLAESVAGLASASLVERLQAVGVPVAPVLDIAEAVVAEQTEALELIQTVPREDIPDLRLVAFPITVNGARSRHRAPPPLLGEHTLEVLEELGFTQPEIKNLLKTGAAEAS